MTPNPVDKMAFTREQAAKLAHLSEGRVESWTGDIFSPTFGGDLYSFADLVALRTLSILRIKFKVSAQELRRAGGYMKKYADSPWSRLKIAVGPSSQRTGVSRLNFMDPNSGQWMSADEAGQLIDPIAIDEVSDHLRKVVKKARVRQSTRYGVFEKTRGICGGRERFSGTRVTTEVVAQMLKKGSSDEEILQNFPTLVPQDVSALRQKFAAA